MTDKQKAEIRKWQTAVHNVSSQSAVNVMWENAMRPTRKGN